MSKSKIWEFDCRLEEEEICGAVIALQSGKGRRRMAAALGAAGVLMLALCALRPENLAYSLLAILSAAEMGFVLYQPVRQAKKMAKQFRGRRCRVSLSGDGYLYTEEEGRIRAAENAKARAVETEEVFALRPDRRRLFILPKRCLDAEACGEIREILGECLTRPAYQCYRRAES